MSSTPKASIIIPNYNGAETLKRAIESAQKQTLEDIEIIIVDDASQDESLAIADSLAEKDNRIRVIKLSENKKKPHAMNLATKQAKGEWIAVLDSDDWYDPKRLEYLLDKAETLKVEMVADNQFCYDAVADAVAGYAFNEDETEKILDIDSFMGKADPRQKFDYGLLKPIFKADFITKHQIYYCEWAFNGQDFYILLDYFAAGGRAFVSKEPLYYYTQPIGSISKQWATGRPAKEYNYPLMEKVNQFYLEKLSSTLSPQNRNKLIIRGKHFRAIKAYASFVRQVRDKNFIDAVKIFLSSPLNVAIILTQRIYSKLK